MNIHEADTEDAVNQCAESAQQQRPETTADDAAEMAQMRVRYLRRVRIGIFMGIGLIWLLTYILKP